MQVQIIAMLTQHGVKAVEVNEASFRALKLTIEDMLPQNKIETIKENSTEALVVCGIKVWYKIESGILVN